MNLHMLSFAIIGVMNVLLIVHPEPQCPRRVRPLDHECRLCRFEKNQIPM